LEFTPVGYGDDIFLAKYASDGALSWVTNAGSTTDDTLTGLAATPDGAALVAGTFVDSIRFGQTTLDNYGSFEGFLAKARAEP